MKKYVLIAGVNGAGKSTLYQTLDSLKNMERVNPDEIVRTFGNWKNPKDMVKAGMLAVKKIEDCLDKEKSFNQETTLCGNSILRNIVRAKELGYIIELHYVGVDNVNIAKQRIQYRVDHGGHGIPNEDVERRYLESFEHLKKILNLCDLVVMYDNTDRFNRFATYQCGNWQLFTTDIPKWFTKYVKN